LRLVKLVFARSILMQSLDAHFYESGHNGESVTDEFFSPAENYKQKSGEKYFATLQ